MDEPQIQETTEGKEEKPAVETNKEDATTERIKRINEAADRLEAAEKRLSERENSLREAEALGRLGGRTNAGDAKLTPEEEFEKKAKEEADKIVHAFK